MLFWGGDYTPLAHHLTFGEPGSLVTLLCRYPFFSGSVLVEDGWFIPTKIGGLCLWCVSFLICLLRFCLKMLLFFSGNRLGILWVDTIFLLLVDQEKCYHSPSIEFAAGVFLGGQPWKLRWQWKIPMFNYKYMFKWWIFHYQCSFSGGARLKQHRKEQRPSDFSALTLYIP